MQIALLSGEIVHGETGLCSVAGFDGLLAQDGTRPTAAIPALIADEIKIPIVVGFGQEEVKGRQTNVAETRRPRHIRREQKRLRHFGIGIRHGIAEPAPGPR